MQKCNCCGEPLVNKDHQERHPVASPATPSRRLIWQGVELDAPAKDDEYSDTQASAFEKLECAVSVL